MKKGIAYSARMVRKWILDRGKVLECDTIAASDGDAGVRIFQTRPNEIDLVILDFVMPKMNGVEAFGGLTRIKPDAFPGIQRASLRYLQSSYLFHLLRPLSQEPTFFAVQIQNDFCNSSLMSVPIYKCEALSFC